MSEKSTIGGHFVHEIEKAASAAFRILSKIPNNPKPDCKGGYFVIRDMKNGKIVFQATIGDIHDVEKVAKHKEVAIRKTWHIRFTGDLTTAYKREPASGIWGGGILVDGGRLAVAFSGHSEEGDEAIVVAASRLLDWMTDDHAAVISNVSANILTRDLIKAMAS